MGLFHTHDSYSENYCGKKDSYDIMAHNQKWIALLIYISFWQGAYRNAFIFSQLPFRISYVQIFNDIRFSIMGSWIILPFSRPLGYTGFDFYSMKSHKILCTRQLLQKGHWYNLCAQSSLEGATMLCFPQPFW